MPHWQTPPSSTAPPLRLDAMLRRLFDVSPDPITVTEMASGRFVMSNDEFCRLTGYGVEELIGRRAVDLGVWAQPEERERCVDRVASEGTVHGFPAVFCNRHGVRVPVLLSVSMFEQDGMQYLLAVMHDVSERERRRLQHEAVLNNAMVGIACTRERTFHLANPRFEQMLGWAPGTLVGMPSSVVWPSGAAYLEASEMALPVLEAGQPLDLERELARRDGSRFWAHIRAQAIDPRHPSEGGTIWIIEDVTERHRNEQALAAAKEQAEAASRAKSQFLANTSHEIRTPLNGLLGLVRLALLTPEGESEVAHQRRHLERIQDSAMALAGVISDILDLSKIEAGRLSLEETVFDLHLLVATAGSAYAELAASQGLEFGVRRHAELPQWFRGDPLRVRQIIGNYLSNALKFSKAGAIELVVEPLSPRGFRIEVSDRGPGISSELMGRLFEPFSQADSSTTREYGGTGLGLNICRQLAALMKGRVGVLSEPGAGSVFWAELPLQPAQPMPGDFRAFDQAVRLLQGARVLLVEDNPVNTLVAEATLQQWGVVVTLAVNGAEALETVRRAPLEFDAVLMDLQMPVMGGIEATQALRLTHAPQQLPVIALTAGVMVSERNAALRCGMNDFLAKPIDLEQLAQVLAHWVEVSRRFRTGASSAS